MEQDSSTADSVQPPEKQFLSEEEFEEVWDARGMKYRVDELHQMLLDRGLNVYIDRPKFRAMFRDIVRGFTVQGDARRDPRTRPRQRFPKVY
jgi:hypothetical protein